MTDESDIRNAALEEAARLLDAEADRMENNWAAYRLSGRPASSLSAIPRRYAEEIRALKSDPAPVPAAGGTE
jgi:hypothetical protein